MAPASAQIGAAADDASPDQTPSVDAGADFSSASRVLGVGWLRTFPYTESDAPIASPGAKIFMPEVFETTLEADVRASLRTALAARGFVLSDDEAGGLILTYSAKVSNEFEKLPPQSPVRFAPSLSDSVRDDRFGRRVPAPIALSGDYVYFDRDINKKGAKSISMTVYLTRGGERVWGGFAAAMIGPDGRAALARVMAAEIADRLGEAEDEPEAVFRAAQNGLSE